MKTITQCLAVCLVLAGAAFGQYKAKIDVLNGTCVLNSTLAAAVTCAGRSGVIEVPTASIVPAMTANVTIPSGVTLKFNGGASCITTTGFALTINGPLVAPSNGQLFCGSGTISGLGEVRPGWFPGADIGAQINTAAASCVAGSQCRITIPPSAQLSFSTGIVFVGNETLECVRHGITTNDSSGDTISILKYTGSGTAITMGSDNGRFIGCDLLLGSSATEGVHIGGTHTYSNHIEDVSIREGGTATTLVHISCPAGFWVLSENL
jgi:hypothetical protein